MNSNADIKTLLPVGEKLKPLLNKSCISESDMKDILSNRGVYIGHKSKTLSIPLLTLSILSPKEFERIQELQKDREDMMKMKTSRLHCEIKENLNDIMELNLITPENILDPMDNFEFNTDLDFTIISPNRLVLDYEIVREDVTKDWTSSESKFGGVIEILKDSSAGDIIFKNEYSSTETENINRKIISKIMDHFKKGGIISPKDKLFEISSDKFNNEERFKFMLQLTNNSHNEFIKFVAVKNVEIGPDKDIEIKLPRYGRWMEGGIRNIIINSEAGETLENLEFISEEEYHKVLILRQLQVEYKFEFATSKGTCIIEYGFPHYFRKQLRSRAFEVSIARLYFSKDSKSTNSKTISRNILNEFQEFTQGVFDEIKLFKLELNK